MSLGGCLRRGEGRLGATNQPALRSQGAAYLVLPTTQPIETRVVLEWPPQSGASSLCLARCGRFFLLTLDERVVEVVDPPVKALDQRHRISLP